MRKPIGKVKIKTNKRLLRRKLAIRKTISGTAEVPRVIVTKTNSHLFAQAIDDCTGRTLCSLSTFGKNACKEASKSVDGGFKLGQAFAKKLKTVKLEAGVYDRAGYKFTGVISSFVKGLREQGIKI